MANPKDITLSKARSLSDKQSHLKLMRMKAYDIIGDIHGCCLTLESLLVELGYQKSNDGIYRHESRNVIFLGDFIDRGPHQQKVISIVRGMIDAGAALSVMGNHEFNAIAYATYDDNTSEYLRPHLNKNFIQHKAFLDAYVDDEAAYTDAIDWFKTLPLWLDLGDIKVIHACWDIKEIARILDFQNGSPLLSNDLLYAASKKGTWQYKSVETLLKGKEITMPDGRSFKDKDGTVRHEIRVRWWDRAGRTYRDVYMGPEHARTHIPDDEISGDHLVEYSHDEPPVFLGHYWMEGKVAPLAPNIACVDYSVARPGGKLVAYRWDGEKQLKNDKFIAINRVE